MANSDPGGIVGEIHVENQYALQNKEVMGLMVLEKMIHYETMEASDLQIEPIWIPSAWFAGLI